VFLYRDLALHYRIDLARLPLELQQVFVELDADASTRAWIDAAIARPNSRMKTLLRDLAMSFVNFYDANGLTNGFQDRLLSTAQWQRLLGRRGARLLDIGAGDGEVTAQLAPLFTEIVTTELSKPMVRRLRRRGYASHYCDLAFEAIDDRDFDVVALQNVIDRTTHPLRLLDHAEQLLARDGRLVVAVPVPIQPVVYAGTSHVEPAEPMPVGAPDFESAVTELYEQVFVPNGYRVTALSRAPYLCSGSAREPVEVLDDVIFVLAR